MKLPKPVFLLNFVCLLLGMTVMTQHTTQHSATITKLISEICQQLIIVLTFQSTILYSETVNLRGSLTSEVDGNPASWVAS